MRFPWQPKEYTRTCAECGYAWRVPRSAARRRLSSLRMISAAPGGRGGGHYELDRQVNAIEAANQPVQVFRHCPKCGADHFTQNS